MTVFALRSAAFSNGVARLHAVTSRGMWKGLWPELPEEEVPIRAITNGIHTRSWLSHEMSELYTRYFGPRFDIIEMKHIDKGAARKKGVRYLWYAFMEKRDNL